MKNFLAILFFAPLIAWGQAQPDIYAEMKKLAWQNGPIEGAVAGKASIKVPKDYVFLDAQNTKRFLELNGNPPDDRHYLIAPKSLSWFAVFSFDESGYIKDDEKIDPDDLLKSLKDSDGPGNEERKRLGMRPLYTDGWQVPPHYDSDTKRLEWGIRLRTDNDDKLVNYTSRLLGRTGVMKAVLVSDPESLDGDIRDFKLALKKFSYNSGESYEEFKSGDKVAEYGLAALVLGGAAAVATKKGFWALLGGFFAAFWKILVGLGAAALAGLGSIFKKNKE
jgi:uncharacterized membrane-anchored protein